METAPHGVIPAIPTPFTEDGSEVDVEALRRVVRHVVDGGVHGIMTTGGTGEFPHLSREERRLVNEVVASEAAGAVTIFAGTSACATWEAIELTRDAAAAGADAAILVPPFYFGIPDDMLYGFFADVAGAGVLPVVVYNNPLYTGNRLSPGLIAELMSARRRRRAEAVRGRPRAARRGDPAGRRERPQPLHRDRQPVLRARSASAPAGSSRPPRRSCPRRWSGSGISSRRATTTGRSRSTRRSSR